MATSARETARVEMTEQIKDVARQHLAELGTELSLRAVARDLDVVSSAVHRYFATKDDLLAALILDAHIALGDAVEDAEAAVPRGQLVNRYLAIGRVTRDWAVARPHEYRLVSGIPGFEASDETVAQAQRTLLVTARILRDGVLRGALRPPPDRLPKAVRADVEQTLALLGLETLPPTLLARAMSAWAQLHGTISFELSGSYLAAVSDPDVYFEHQLRVMARYLGLLG